ncbi:MAG TPA: GxxExxY protein [Anaerolineales bacterium]|nr:GxxExxY protein [Anaerolineales bacterium]
MSERKVYETPGKHNELTDKIIAVFWEVLRELGYGFSEVVYENALVIALKSAGFKVDQQMKIEVFFRGYKVGEFFADIVVNDLVILELKAVQEILLEHEAQLLNYLKATTYEVGLILNFGSSRKKIKRLVYDNDKKNALISPEDHQAA